jgi:hypothetical protein
MLSILLMSQLTGNDEQMSKLNMLTQMREDFKKKRDSIKGNKNTMTSITVSIKRLRNSLRNYAKQ